MIVESINKTNVSDKILRFEFKENINPKMGSIFSKKPLGREKIESLATGNQLAMKNISQDKIKSIEIPLPPFEEQHEIVRRVEQLFALADSLEAKYSNAMHAWQKSNRPCFPKPFAANSRRPTAG